MKKIVATMMFCHRQPYEGSNLFFFFFCRFKISYNLLFRPRSLPENLLLLFRSSVPQSNFANDKFCRLECTKLGPCIRRKKWIILPKT